MNARLGLVCALLLTSACASSPQEREAQVVKTAIDAGRLACGVASVKRIELTDAEREWCEGRR